MTAIPPASSMKPERPCAFVACPASIDRELVQGDRLVLHGALAAQAGRWPDEHPVADAVRADPVLSRARGGAGAESANIACTAPGLAQVWQQAVALNQAAKVEHQREAEFYARHDAHNAQLIAKGRQDRAAYCDQIWTSIKPSSWAL